MTSVEINSQNTPHLSQSELGTFLLNVAPVRPIFIWGPPGVGKSSIVEKFSEIIGLECVSLLGSQLAPEDIMGVPQIVDGRLRFCPPRMIARDDPYCLFLDEFNSCSQDVQKAFYSLIHDRKIGEYTMPEGSVIVSAGNRASDNAIVRKVSSALINRMVNVHMFVSHVDWVEWAYQSDIHPLVLTYVRENPDHLWSPPPEDETPYSTPRSWHMLSDALKKFGGTVPLKQLEILTHGSISREHVASFLAFEKQVNRSSQTLNTNSLSTPQGRSA